MDQFFYSLDGRTLGPVSVDELQAMIARREIQPDVPIWASGMTDWSTLTQWTAKRDRERAEQHAQAMSGTQSPSPSGNPAAPLSPDEVIPIGSTIPPRRVRFGYGIGVLMTAALAALVPILYLLAAYFIARWSWQYFDAGGGTYMQKLRVYGSTFGSSTYAGFLFRLIYYLPAIVGGSIAAFMVVVLIFRRSERERPMLMNPASQPRLQEVIERLCLAIGAPVPRRIVLSATPNAAAGLANGPSGWLFGRVVLLIGLPLAAALDVRQFIGVLAHEFGHFTQGSGMRLSAFVRALNHRMYDAATEETQIDEYLTHAMTNGWTVISIPVAGIKAGIGLARLGLRVLVRVNHLLSCVLLRQMEFHADQTQAQVAGSEAMAQALARVTVLDAVYQQFHYEAAFSHALPPNLPRYLAKETGKLPPQEVSRIIELTMGETTRWSSTHPSTGDRIAAVEDAGAAGIVTSEAPASELFDHFHDLSHALTESHYRDYAPNWAMTRAYTMSTFET